MTDQPLLRYISAKTTPFEPFSLIFALFRAILVIFKQKSVHFEHF